MNPLCLPLGRSGVSALPGGAVAGVVGSCGPSAWRQRCSIPLVAGIGGGVWVLPHPSAAPHFACWLVVGRQWASACSPRSGRRGDSGLPFGSGPRRRATESTSCFKWSRLHVHDNFCRRVPSVLPFWLRKISDSLITASLGALFAVASVCSDMCVYYFSF